MATGIPARILPPKAYVKDGRSWKEVKLNDEHHKM